MKLSNTIVSLLFVIQALVGLEVFSDTIDFYHVSYNEQTIASYNLHDIGRNRLIAIDVGRIVKTDSLKVVYWDDTPCDDCKCYLTIYKAGDCRNGYQIERIGVGNAFTFSLQDMLLFSRRFNVYEYEIEYFEAGTYKRKLFNLKLRDFE